MSCRPFHKKSIWSEILHLKSIISHPFCDFFSFVFSFKPKSLIDRLLGGKSSSQLGAAATESSETEQSESETEKQQPEFQEQSKDQEKENVVVVAPISSTESAVPDF